PRRRIIAGNATEAGGISVDSCVVKEGDQVVTLTAESASAQKKVKDRALRRDFRGISFEIRRRYQRDFGAKARPNQQTTQCTATLSDSIGAYNPPSPVFCLPCGVLP